MVSRAAIGPARERLGERYFDRRNACAKCGRTEFKNASGKLGHRQGIHDRAPGRSRDSRPVCVGDSDHREPRRGGHWLRIPAGLDSFNGTHMTRFGRYPDNEVLVAGSLSNASGSPGQRIQKQIGEAGDRQVKEANRILGKAGA